MSQIPEITITLQIRLMYGTLARGLWELKPDGNLNWVEPIGVLPPGWGSDGIQTLTFRGRPVARMTPRWGRKPGEPEIDPWKLRDDFLTVETEQELVDFLNRTTYWGPDSPRTVKDYWDFQALIRRVLLRSPMKWKRLRQRFGFDKVEGIRGGFSVRVPWPMTNPVGEIYIDSALSAILASVVIDAIRGARFGVCLRPDCQKVYRIKTAHKREYCSHKCAHVQGTRRIRGHNKRK